MLSELILVPADEHAKLVEMGANTSFDYLFHENAPFCAVSGKLLRDYGIYDTLKQQSGEFCVVNYIYLPGLVVRFPGIAILCVLGMMIGIRGFIKFSKYNSIQLSFSFLFYAGMNVSGLICHSLLAISCKYKYIFALFEKACTGTSGLFLALTLYDLLHKKAHSSSTVGALHLFGIAFIIALLCIVESVAVFIYICGCMLCIVVSFHILQYQRRFNNVDVNLIKIGQYGVVILIAIVICFSTSSILCNATKGIYNGASAFFAITHIGFIIVHHFLSKLFDKDHQKKDKKF